MSEHIEMPIVRNDICSVGSECAIHKFIIVVVGFNKSKVELRVYKLYVITLYDCVDNVFCYTRSSLAGYYFLILFQNLIGYT